MGKDMKSNGVDMLSHDSSVVFFEGSVRTLVSERKVHVCMEPLVKSSSSVDGILPR